MGTGWVSAQPGEKDLYFIVVNGSWDLSLDPSRAQFKGNNRFLDGFLRYNFIPPPEALRTKAKGMAVLKFRVTPTGELEDIELTNKIGAGYDGEAVRLLKLTREDWKPGFLKNRNVADSITLRIYFYSDRKDDSDWDYHFQRAQKYYHRGKFDRGLAHINRALDFNPFRKEFILLKGRILEAKQNLQGACDCWKDITTYWEESFDDLGLTQCETIIQSPK